MNNNYNPKKLEIKWQKVWSESGLYETDLASKKPKFYNLAMFPYPSGEFLHMGHGYSYAGADVYGRYKKLKGFNVFEPIGYDAFGLPAENYAIKNKKHPKKSTAENIAHAEKQLKSFGCMFDWSRTVNTSSPEYYKWTQWLFLQLFKQGLAYQKEAPVNWCPHCLTVLANEQVIDGACERCDSEVVQKNMKQWFFKITDYAERLINDLDKVDWPKASVIKQRNWIGRSEGTLVKFEILSSHLPAGKAGLSALSSKQIEVFTTRVDTIFGCTYLVLAPENPMVDELTTEDQKKEVEKYKINSQKLTEIDRQLEEREKTGIFTGSYAVNPFNNEKVPIWVADYVLSGYGTGAVMAVPAHDERDFEFAKKFNLEIIEVITESGNKQKNLKKAFTEYGELINSGEFTGLTSQIAKEKMTDWLEKKKLGIKKINYRLRDWSIGRQRYWGSPIPIIYCEKCASTGSAQDGIIPVSEKDLPVMLPEVKNFRPTGTGKGPLAGIPKFVNTNCPKCGGKAERETDTMDTFVCSSFYFLRYPAVPKQNEMMDKEITKKWLPVDMYVGGAEHVTMHLLYARFVTKALFDAKLINFSEPFLKLRHQGMILGPNGKKMSKSKGNVVIPDETIKQWGADVFRTAVLFMGPFEDGGPWNPKGLGGIEKFFYRFWRLVLEVLSAKESSISNENIGIVMNNAIKKVGSDIESFKFNTAISSLMICLNKLYEIKTKEGVVAKEWKEALGVFVVLISPFAPHLSEEIWEKFGNKGSVFSASWPSYNEALNKKTSAKVIVQINGKVRDELTVNSDLSEEELFALALKSEKIKKYIINKKIKKKIYIKNKILNLVV